MTFFSIAMISMWTKILKIKIDVGSVSYVKEIAMYGTEANKEKCAMESKERIEMVVVVLFLFYWPSFFYLSK